EVRGKCASKWPERWPVGVRGRVAPEPLRCGPSQPESLLPRCGWRLQSLAALQAVEQAVQLELRLCARMTEPLRPARECGPGARDRRRDCARPGGDLAGRAANERIAHDRAEEQAAEAGQRAHGVGVTTLLHA